MKTSSSAALVVRDAIPWDLLPLTRLLTRAIMDSPVTCWLDPVEKRRPLTVLAYLGGLVQRTIAEGVVRVAEDGGEFVGAALWSACPAAGMTAGMKPVGASADRTLSEVHLRQRRLERLLRSRRPLEVACQHLVCVGVRPDRQGQGIGSYLLNGQHAFLHLTETPVYVVVPGDGLQRWFERFGYFGIGSTQLLPGGPPMQAMWRPPGPADVC